MMDLLTCVRVVVSVQKGQKLRLRGGQLSIESPSMFAPLVRWFSNDGRKNTMSYLQHLVQRVEEMLTAGEPTWIRDQLLLLLPLLETSFASLQVTYNYDSLVVAQLGVLMDQTQHLHQTYGAKSRPPPSQAMDRPERPIKSSR